MSAKLAGNKHRVVILGGGVAGIQLATHLGGRKTASAVITAMLIDREPAHVWKPMLHTIAAGTSDVYQQQTSFIAQAREHGFVYRPGRVARIDRGQRSVHVAAVLGESGQPILGEVHVPYDTLIVSVGSRANDFGTPGVSEHCYTIDLRSQAIAFNGAIRIKLLQPFDRHDPLSICIVGGGATGVELAAELVQLTELAEYYGGAGLAHNVTVALLESGDRILPAFPKRVADAVRQRLEKLGVRVKTRARVTSADALGFALEDGLREDADIKVWAAGVKAPDVIASLESLELTRTHQLIVNGNLQTTRDSHVYALGDCASFVPVAGSPALPPTAQVADQQASYLIKHLPALLNGGPVPPFRFRDLGSLVALGGYGAYGSLGRFGFFKGAFIRGRVAQLGHTLLYRSHQARLHGFWRGGLLWLADHINSRVRPAIRLD